MNKYTDNEIRQQARSVIENVMVDNKCESFTVDDLAKGMRMEYEHGSDNPLTNVTNDDPIMTGKIALAHLLKTRNGFKQSDYYDAMDVVRNAPPNYFRNVDAKQYWYDKHIGYIVLIVLLLIVLNDIVCTVVNPDRRTQLYQKMIVITMCIYLFMSWM